MVRPQFVLLDSIREMPLALSCCPTVTEKRDSTAALTPYSRRTEGRDTNSSHSPLFVRKRIIIRDEQSKQQQPVPPAKRIPAQAANFSRNSALNVSFSDPTTQQPQRDSVGSSSSPFSPQSALKNLKQGIVFGHTEGGRRSNLRQLPPKEKVFDRKR